MVCGVCVGGVVGVWEWCGGIVVLVSVSDLDIMVWEWCGGSVVLVSVSDLDIMVWG